MAAPDSLSVITSPTDTPTLWSAGSLFSVFVVLAQSGLISTCKGFKPQTVAHVDRASRLREERKKKKSGNKT